MAQGMRARQFVQGAPDAFLLSGAAVIMPDDKSARFDHGKRLGRVALDIGIGVRAIDEDQVAAFDVGRFVERFAIAK